jgi:inward rectifier potassium channel
MTASWPAFIGGAALIFLGFNAVFASFYWIGNQPISNVPGNAYAVISNHEGKPTLMVRFANERQNIIGNAAARLWLLRNEVSSEGRSSRRFYELPLVRSEHPALALSWTLYHVLDAQSPLRGRSADDLEASSVSLVVVVSGYDIVAAQTVHARKAYDHSDIRFGQRYADILDASQGGRIRIDYSRFHESWRNRLSHPCHANILCKPRGERAK